MKWVVLDNRCRPVRYVTIYVVLITDMNIYIYDLIIHSSRIVLIDYFNFPKNSNVAIISFSFYSLHSLH